MGFFMKLIRKRSTEKGLIGKFVKKTVEDYIGLLQVGQMFGDWCVKSDIPILTKYGPYFLVEHKDIEIKYVSYQNLVQGKSTGSLKKLTYGIKNYLKLRGRWEQIMSRCYDKKSKVYKHYGARGIYVEEKFKDCVVFCRYVSTLPDYGNKEKYQLDRIDNNKGYEEGNLRWVTPSINNRNTRRNRIITLYGEKYVISDFYKKTSHLSPKYIDKLFREGLTAEQIFEKLPTGRIRRKY